VTINYTTVPTATSSSSVAAGVTAVWVGRMRELQGGLLVASLTQLLIGASGLASVLLRYIGPLTVAPTITLVALPLFNVAAGFADKNWWIAFLYVQLSSLLTLQLFDTRWLIVMVIIIVAYLARAVA